MQDITRRRALKAAGVTGLAVSGMGLASARGDSDVKKKLAELREATAKYHDLDVAKEDGYSFGEEEHCVSNPEGEGAMGFHAGNFSKIGYGTDHTDPEVLVYEQRGNKKHLVACEFLVIAEEAPTMFGQEMHLFIPADHPANPFEDPGWALHAWVWKNNPNGMFVDFNPNVSCPDEEDGGHEH